MDISKTMKVVLYLDNGQYIASLQASGREHSALAANVIRSGQAVEASLAKTELSAGQTAAALRMLPAQFTDIFTGLASGQSPMTVLIQQGGQLKDSFGGVVPAARALTGYVAGLVNPLTLAAGAAGVLAVAYYQGSKEADAYSRAIVMSGNAVGATVSSMQDAARGASAVVGTQAAAADAVAQLGATGQIAATNLQAFTETALRMERDGGQAVSSTVEQFERLGAEPVKASLKLNESYRYLTTAIYEQIRALEASGRQQEAAELAQRTFAASMNERTRRLEGNLGTIQRGWRAIGDAARWAWDKMLNVGRKDSVGDELAKAQQELQDRLKRGPTNERPEVRASWEKGNERLRQVIALLQQKLTLEEKSAAAEAERQKQEQAGIAWSQRVYDTRSKAAKLAAEEAKARQEFKDAGKDEVRDRQELDAVLAAIRDKYKETGREQNKAAKEQERQLALMAELGGLSSSFYKDWAALSKLAEDRKLSQEQLVELQAKLLEKQPAMVAAAREERKELDARVKAWHEIERAQERASSQALEALQKSAQQAEQEAQKLLDQERAAALASAGQISLAEAVERVALARARDNYAKAVGAGADGQTLLALQKEIEARERIVGLVGTREAREALKKTADEAAKELQRVTEQYEQGLTNAAMQGGKSLREYITGMLRATAFRIVLDPVMRPLAGLLTSLTGASSAAAGQAGAPGIMSIASMASSAYTALTSGVASSITAGFAKLAGTSFGQAIGLSNSTAIVGNNPSAFVPAGGQLTPLGQTIGTGLGMLGSGLAGYGISSAISNGYTTGGNTVNVLSGIASAFLGPIAGVVGGLINRAFGRKLKDSGIEGTLGGSAGFEGNSYQFYKGGWLRSDKTERGTIDPALDAGLDKAVKQMQVSLAALATAIDQPTQAISGFSQAIKVSFNGLDEAGIQEKIKDTLADYNEALASAFIQSMNTSELPAWVARLVGNTDASAVARLQEVAEWPAKLLQNAGTSRDQLAQLYAQGMASGDARAAGQAVAGSLVASIEAALLGNASAQVFDIINQGIVTPLLDAMITGQNVAQALSDAAVQKTIERAKATATAFAELYNNAEFKATMEQLRTTVSSALGTAGAALQYTPRYTAAIADHTAATQAATDVQREAEDTARRIADERRGLQNELDGLTLTRLELLAKERAAIDESNRALWDAVQAAKLRRQIAEALPALADKYRTEPQRQAFAYTTIAADLAAAGVGVSAQQLAAATKDQILAAAQAIYEMGGTSDDTRLALIRAASSLAELKDAATAAASSAADAALSALQRSVEAQKTAISEAANARVEALQAEARAQQAAQETAQEALAAAARVAESLGRAVRTLRGQVESAMVQDLAAARRFIEDAVRTATTTGVLPDEEQLARAIESVTADQQQRYATYADWEAAQLDQANQLAALGAVGEAQKSVAERQLAATKAQSALLQEQIKTTQDSAAAATRALDQQLQAAQDRLAVLRDSNARLQTIAEATAGFENALQQLAQALAASAVRGGAGQGSVPPAASGTGRPGGQGGALILNGPNGSQYDSRTDTFYAGGTGLPYQASALGAAAVAAVEAGNALGVYQAAVQAGITSQMLAAWTGASSADLNAWAAANGLPAFDKGTNYVPRDMIALVHEGEQIVPKRYNPAAQAGAWTPAGAIGRAMQGRGTSGEASLQALVATLAGVVEQLAGMGGGMAPEDSTNLRRVREVLEAVATGRARLGVTAS